MITFKKECDIIKKLNVIRIKFSLSKKATKIKKISQLIWTEQHCFENKDQCISKCFGPKLCICKEHAAQGWVCISRLYISRLCCIGIIIPRCIGTIIWTKWDLYALLIEVNHFFYSNISEGGVLCLLVEFRGHE